MLGTHTKKEKKAQKRQRNRARRPAKLNGHVQAPHSQQKGLRIALNELGKREVLIDPDSSILEPLNWRVVERGKRPARDSFSWP